MEYCKVKVNNAGNLDRRLYNFNIHLPVFCRTCSAVQLSGAQAARLLCHSWHNLSYVAKTPCYSCNLSMEMNAASRWTRLYNILLITGAALSTGLPCRRLGVWAIIPWAEFCSSFLLRLCRAASRKSLDAHVYSSGTFCHHTASTIINVRRCELRDISFEQALQHLLSQRSEEAKQLQAPIITQHQVYLPLRYRVVMGGIVRGGCPSKIDRGKCPGGTVRGEMSGGECPDEFACQMSSTDSWQLHGQWSAIAHSQSLDRLVRARSVYGHSVSTAAHHPNARAFCQPWRDWL